MTTSLAASSANKPSKQQVEADLKDLRKQIGRYAFDRLRAGKAVIHVWRRSSPHNKWIQNADENRGDSMLWHSEGWGDFPGVLRMYDLVDESGNIITSHWLHSDGGKPDHSIYALKKEYRTSKKRVRYTKRK